MPPQTTPLAAFILERLPELATAREMFAACDAAGFDLAAVVDVLADPHDHLPESDAWLVERSNASSLEYLAYFLVEVAGAKAGSVAARSLALRDVDVTALHAQCSASIQAGRALRERRPVEEICALISQSWVGDQQWMLMRMGRAYPVETLASAVDTMAADHVHIVGASLRERMTALEAFEALLGEVDAACLLRALAIFWEVEVPSGSDEDARLATYARVARAENKPLHAALAYAQEQGPPEWWLPILRAEGLRPSEAALHLVESDTSGMQIAVMLAAAGYTDDEVLGALLANGLGSRTSLSALRSSGWSLPQMVRTLAAREVLLPEVRRHLHELGVPTEMQRVLLTAEWDESLVDLISAPPHASLPRQTRE